MKTTAKILTLVIASALTFTGCRNSEKEAQIKEDTRQATIDSLKMEDAKASKQKAIDSMKAVAAQHQAHQKTVVVNNTPAEQKRKGWSGAAKGAVIGAGVGAISGAVIDKKKPGTGAIIGGLAGAGLGAGTGAVIDDSKKKKQQK